MRRAVYAGSLDPLTNGHMWMIREGAKQFDELIVAIGVNPEKKYTFSLEDRLDMLRKSVRHMPNVRVDSFESEFLVNYVSSMGAQYILRGLRSPADYESEKTMRYVNEDMNPDITTSFLMPHKDLIEVSSSLVKGFVESNGWERVVEGYVPRPVYNGMLLHYKGMFKRWKSLWERMGAQGDYKRPYEELLAMYGEKHRFYHNLVHIAHALREFDEAAAGLDNPEQIEAAIWYHDAVYDPKAHDNEERSAYLALNRLTRGLVKPNFADSTVSLIMDTKHQCAPKTSSGMSLVDIDLAVLGADDERYNEYSRDIRDEYAHVPEEQFRQGRKAILQGFLDRPSIYSTEFFRKKYEDKARANLQKEITRLSA